MNKDTRGTHTPSVKTLERRAKKAEAHNAAVQSAHQAGYRKGFDDRAHDRAQDNEINKLRNQIAAIQGETIAIMDRSLVKDTLDLIAHRNKTDPDGSIWIMSVATINAFAREMTRAYDKEKQS